MVKFAGIQINVGKCKQTNLEKASQLVGEAAKAGALVACLPECFNSPYGLQYFTQYAEPIPGQTTDFLSSLAREHQIHIIGGSIPEREGNKLYNTCCVFDPTGQIITKFRKIHLADISIPGKITNRESDVFTPGRDITLFTVKDMTFGLGICYDLRFSELAHVMRDRGAHVIVYPSVYNMVTGPLYWELLCRARAVDAQVYVVGVEPARDPTAGYVSWAHTLGVSPTGEVIVEGGEEEGVVYVELEKGVVEGVRASIPTFTQKRRDLYEVVDVAKR